MVSKGYSLQPSSLFPMLTGTGACQANYQAGPPRAMGCGSADVNGHDDPMAWQLAYRTQSAPPVLPGAYLFCAPGEGVARQFLKRPCGGAWQPGGLQHGRAKDKQVRAKGEQALKAR